jgi:U3 small nucleolar ribonucleoprotein protein LCP5
MSGESDEEEERAKLYVPPRVVAMPYDGDDDEGVKERKRKKKVQSSIVQELRNEYLDIPEEVNDVGSGFRSHRETKEEKEREMFEEANFIRLPKKRKGQGTRQRGGASDVLDDLDLGAFPSGSAHQPGSGGKKKLSARKRSAGGSKTKRGHRHK